ncbi:MAG: tyrosine-protein phosphatase, partial [Planctomycetota bacterium]
IVVQGWSKEAAIEEMTGGGYGFHAVYCDTLIPFLRNIDVEALRASVRETERQDGRSISTSAPEGIPPEPRVPSSSEAQAESARRPATRAEKIENPHLVNFFRVSGELYRGEQPDAEGFQELERLGVRTVISLRKVHSDRGKVEGTSLRYAEIPMFPFHPEKEDVDRFLRLVAQKENGPFFVHCQHGSDRTGTISAVYRMVVQGWSKGDAIEEMTRGGFGFHEIWREALLPFLENLDLETLRAQYAKDVEGPAEPLKNEVVKSGTAEEVRPAAVAAP